MSNLMKSGNALANTDRGVVPAIGGVSAVAGGSTLAVLALAAILPGGVLLWAVLLSIAGLLAFLRG